MFAALVLVIPRMGIKVILAAVDPPGPVVELAAVRAGLDAVLHLAALVLAQLGGRARRRPGQP